MRGPRLILAVIVLCFVAVLLGSMLTRQAVPGWYQELRRPAWTPPGWLFGPVWTCLYAMMAVAASIVWRRAGWPAASTPLVLFTIQLALNAAWTPLFFGLKMPGLAFAGIVVLWCAILFTTVAFWRVSRTAGWLMLPYLAWVSFASALNLAIWRLNA